MSEPRFDELLRRLSDAEAEFVVIGGLAVSAWGVIRGTKDVDIVVSSEVENLKRVAEVAVAAGGHVQQGESLLGSPMSIASALASGEQVMIETDLGRLDVVAEREIWQISRTWKPLTVSGSTGPVPPDCSAQGSGRPCR